MTREQHETIYREMASLMGHEPSKKLLDEQWDLVKDVASTLDANQFKREMEAQWVLFGKDKFFHQRASKN